jgi:nucleoside-diphosphate-sugar epimerase
MSSAKEVEQNANKKKILIFGRGQLASHIVCALLSDESTHITIVHRNDPKLIFMNPDMQKYEDRVDRITIKQYSDFDLYRLFFGGPKYDTIINADSIHDSKFASNNPVETSMHNEVFVTRLLDILKMTDYKGRLIHLSSDKVYGIQKDLPITEEAKPNPLGDRSGSRFAQEIKITSKAKAANIRYIILRLGNIFGEYTPMETCINTWVKNALLNEPLTIYGGGANERNSRDFVSIYDISHLVRKLCTTMADDNTVDNDIYNIGGCYKSETHLQNINEGIKLLFSPIYEDITTEYGPWRNKKEDEGLRIWLDCSKAIDKLKYEQMKQFDSYSYKEVAFHVAQYELRWGDIKMLDLERGLGEFHEWRKIKVAKLLGKIPQDMSPEIARSVSRLNKVIDEGMSEFEKGKVAPPSKEDIEKRHTKQEG